MDASLEKPLTLACALEAEERTARKAGARAARVGLAACLPPPEGDLVGFGLAGALVPGVAPGTLLTARRIVDAGGRVLWEQEPLAVPGAQNAVICTVASVADSPAERALLAERTGALAVDMESGALAATGRLAGVVRAVSDGPERPLGSLASAATADGRTAWRRVVRSLWLEPWKTIRAAFAARRALASLERAAAALGDGRGVRRSGKMR